MKSLFLDPKDPEADICDEDPSIWNLTEEILMRSLNKLKKCMSELEEHDCECCSKITKAIMNTQALL
jgi:hypothetical protein